MKSWSIMISIARSHPDVFPFLGEPRLATAPALTDPDIPSHDVLFLWRNVMQIDGSWWYLIAAGPTMWTCLFDSGAVPDLWLRMLIYHQSLLTFADVGVKKLSFVQRPFWCCYYTYILARALYLFGYFTTRLLRYTKEHRGRAHRANHVDRWEHLKWIPCRSRKQTACCLRNYQTHQI